MSLYTKFVASALFPLHERLKGHSSAAALRAMERSQWLPPQELEQLQLRNLRAFLQRIGRDVPYYRELFARLDFDPASLSTLADLQALPLTGKADIRANMDSLRADNAGSLERFSTGGSSGEPLVFYRGKERVSHDVAAKWRATRWWDVDIGDPEIVVWGSPIELGSQDRIRLLRDRLLRTELLSAFEMSNANMLQFTQRLRAFRPRMLFGYPSSLALLADYVSANGYKVDDLGIRVVFVTSERLYDHQRESIERAFGCPVANGYGGRDAGFIAHQCPSGGMHITAEDIVVEIVGEDGRVLPAGERGEIVVTHMRTADFPFLRYRTGDIGTLTRESCPCGRGLPLLAEIDGRTTDFVRAADGTVLHGLALIYVLRELPQVEEFKIIQDSLTQVTVQLVAAPEERALIESTVTEQFRRRLGDALVVQFDYVGSIPRETSGKFRYVVSRLEVGQAAGQAADA
ncbi:MAG: capsule biosynthesis protein CapK [Halioglobus sp.]|nr:capsule biosynthesis protein CapK [Halioglobus sp.]|tara:strand:- start:3249 stop:4628 length:1380 start_codon:yes stop_codon:yes gene_type:complete